MLNSRRKRRTILELNGHRLIGAFHQKPVMAHYQRKAQAEQQAKEREQT
jgi:hypothetical protein